MTAFFAHEKRKVMVAVAFDERLEALLEAAEALCRHLQAPLRLTHVLEPLATLSRSVLATGLEAGPFALSAAWKSEALKNATARLGHLAKSLPPDLAVETSVVEGDPPRALARDAADAGVGVIVAGACRSGAGTGLATVVSLILEAEVPVLVMNDGARLRREGPGLTVLVADDFCDDRRAALAAGFALAEAWPRSTLVHTHVETYAHLADRPPKGDGEKEVASRVAAARAAAEDAVRTRAGAHAESLVAGGGHYRFEIVAGGVAAEIDRAAHAARADLVVFGQHRSVHRHAAHPGQMPFKLMLAQPRPVLVVPVEGG